MITWPWTNRKWKEEPWQLRALSYCIVEHCILNEETLSLRNAERLRLIVGERMVWICPIMYIVIVTSSISASGVLWVLCLWFCYRACFTRREKYATSTGKCITRSTSVHRTQWSQRIHASQTIRKIDISDTNSTTYCKGVNLCTVDRSTCIYSGRTETVKLR